MPRWSGLPRLAGGETGGWMGGGGTLELLEVLVRGMKSFSDSMAWGARPSVQGRLVMNQGEIGGGQWNAVESETK